MRRFQIGLGVLLFALAAAAIARFLNGTSPAAVLAAMRDAPPRAVLLALAAACANYLVLTGYDALALLLVRRPLPWRRVAPVSFVAYTLSHNLGVSILSGGAARVRYYARLGLSVLQASQVALVCNVTFWIGFFALGGAVFLFHPLPLPDFLRLPFESTAPLGLTLLLLVAGGFLWLATGHRSLSFRGRSFALPTAPLFLAQLLLSAADWSLAALVLHLVLPLGAYPDTLALFLLAQVAAMASNVPGGMGVFEGIVLFATKGRIDPAHALGLLLVYRLVYYLLPLTVALPLMAWLGRLAPPVEKVPEPRPQSVSQRAGGTPER